MQDQGNIPMMETKLQPIHIKRISIFILIFVLLIFSLTMPLPQNIEGPCRLESTAVWYLACNGADQITTGWSRNLQSAGGGVKLLHFERPDLIDVNIVPALHDGCFVEKDDTIAIITSLKTQGNLSVVEANLEKARAEYNSLLAGARIEDMDIAKNRIERAKAALDAKELELNRLKSLYQSEFVQLSDLQTAEGRYEVLKAELDLANAKLAALQAGSRPEDIRVAEAQITSIQREVESIRSALGEREVIVSPVSGQVRMGGEEGYLVRVECIDTLAVFMIIPEAVTLELKEGQPMEVTFIADASNPIQAELWRTDYFTNGNPGAYALALLNNEEGALQIGMTGRASISIGRQTLYDGIKTKFFSAN